MFIRILSGIIGLPMLIGLLFIGGDVLKIVALICSIIGLHEFFKANDISTVTRNLSYVATAIYYTVAGSSLDLLNTVIIITTFMLSLFISMVFLFPKISIKDVSISFLGFVYICVMLSFVYFVRSAFDNGKVYVYVIFITAFATDTFAYFTGMFLGKNKLAPILSPKKTIEGAIGGIVGSVVTIVIFGYIVKTYYNVNVEFTYIFWGLLGFMCAIMAQLGDLTASAIKRENNVKDYGNLIPGHGGILDRCDSVLFTAPVVYILLIALV